MPNLQVRDINAQLYNWLCVNAKLANHSISQHVITILQEKAAAATFCRTILGKTGMVCGT